MTDLPELIANVYRACGMEVEVSNADEGVMSMWDNGRLVYVEGDEMFSLGPFVRDIVPTLNERGLEPTFMQVGDRWEAELWPRRVHPVGESRVISFGDSPVEACFRVAWEALIPGENP